MRQAGNRIKITASLHQSVLDGVDCHSWLPAAKAKCPLDNRHLIQSSQIHFQNYSVRIFVTRHYSLLLPIKSETHFHVTHICIHRYMCQTQFTLRQVTVKLQEQHNLNNDIHIRFSPQTFWTNDSSVSHRPLLKFCLLYVLFKDGYNFLLNSFKQQHQIVFRFLNQCSHFSYSLCMLSTATICEEIKKKKTPLSKPFRLEI